MAASIPPAPRGGKRGFRQLADVFLAGAGLPFASLLSAERIERIFEKHGCRFGAQGIYTTALTVWAFLSQVLRDGKEASCQAAVAQIVCYCQQQGLEPPTSDTGDYCHARAKVSEAALHELSNDVAEQGEQAADRAWLWKEEYHAKLIDGLTFTMPDTPANQARYPHPKSQQPGVGLPIALAVVILWLATACVLDMKIGPYQGKETGEPALLRDMLQSLQAGDIAVADRFYCSFLMIALLLGQGTQVCARKHQRRHSDFRRGQRLDKYDHLIAWTRPERPEWMSEDAYAQIPQTLVLREIRYQVVVPGRRTRTLDVITTLIDAETFPKEEIAELYGFRWNSEMDIRSIKVSLNLAHLRCKSPEMVQREVWMTILAYHLIRTTATGAAALHGKQPRQISFTSTCQYVLGSWTLLSWGLLSEEELRKYALVVLHQIAQCEVANRPGRLEPRVLKRRRHRYPLMQKPRRELRLELRKRCT